MTSEHPNATGSAGGGTRAVKYWVPECLAHGDGVGPVINVGTARGKLLVLTLIITRAIERATLVSTFLGRQTRPIGTTNHWSPLRERNT
jgi:hypothetical protein